jgi:hypothetical protein
MIRCDGCGKEVYPGQTTGWEKDDYDGDFCPECLASQTADALNIPSGDEMSGWVSAVYAAAGVRK